MAESIRWTVYDRYDNAIYLTQERWQHIVEENNHPEMVDYEAELKAAIQQGVRRQDSLVANKYRYTKAFDRLPQDNTHIVAIVLFTVRENDAGELEPNNFIVTAYQKEIR